MTVPLHSVNQWQVTIEAGDFSVMRKETDPHSRTQPEEILCLKRAEFTVGCA